MAIELLFGLLFCTANPSFIEYLDCLGFKSKMHKYLAALPLAALSVLLNIIQLGFEIVDMPSREKKAKG